MKTLTIELPTERLFSTISDCLISSLEDDYITETLGEDAIASIWKLVTRSILESPKLIETLAEGITEQLKSEIEEMSIDDIDSNFMDGALQKAIIDRLDKRSIDRLITRAEQALDNMPPQELLLVFGKDILEAELRSAIKQHGVDILVDCALALLK